MKRDNYVVVAGTFDLFHVGHLKLLERASRFGKVIALVNTNRFVKQFKGITPTMNTIQRSQIVHGCRHVEEVYSNSESDLTITIDSICNGRKITGIIFGDDYDIEKYRKQTGITRKWQQEHDMALIQFPRTDGISSTQIRHELK